MSRGRSRLPLLLYGLLGVAVGVYFLSSREGDEQKIERRLESLGSLIEKAGPEAELDALGRARDVAEFFVDPPEIRLIPFGEALHDHPSLIRSLLGVRARADTIGVEFRDQQIEVFPSPGPKRAELRCIVAVTSNSDLGRTRDRYRFHFFWTFEGGEWRLQRVDLLEILEGASLL